jgi:NitT/TauT family transport system permease protein
MRMNPCRIFGSCMVVLQVECAINLKVEDTQAGSCLQSKTIPRRYCGAAQKREPFRMPTIEREERSRSWSLSTRLRPVAFVVALLVLWQIAVSRHPDQLLPGPWAVVKGIGELLQHGLLLKYVVASLFRVTWGFALAAVIAIPLGLTLGWYQRGEMAVYPLVQIFRPISPLAWIPLAILWFGVGDLAAIFLIFVGCFFPLLLTAMSAVRNVPAVYINVGRNFGMSKGEFVYRVLYPAVLPQLIVGSRITMGIAWLVVVAAEMIAVNSGLGFLIIDARNAGNRYDLVIAGMVIIGTIGLLLDLGMRSLERVKSFHWSYSEE